MRSGMRDIGPRLVCSGYKTLHLGAVVLDGWDAARQMSWCIGGEAEGNTLEDDCQTRKGLVCVVTIALSLAANLDSQGEH